MGFSHTEKFKDDNEWFKTNHLSTFSVNKQTGITQKINC